LPSCRRMAAAVTRLKARLRKSRLRKSRLRRAVPVISVIPSAGERRVDDRELLIVLLEVDAGDPEHAAELRVLDFHRAGRGGGAGRGLREGGRARGMERDGAFDLLHDLVDVAVEHGDGTETLQ